MIRAAQAWSRDLLPSDPRAAPSGPRCRYGFFDRFPQKQPFELFEELVCFSAAQLGLDAGLIELYRKRGFE
jgi:hypothetical protein